MRREKETERKDFRDRVRGIRQVLKLKPLKILLAVCNFNLIWFVLC